MTLPIPGINIPRSKLLQGWYGAPKTPGPIQTDAVSSLNPIDVQSLIASGKNLVGDAQAATAVAHKQLMQEAAQRALANKLAEQQRRAQLAQLVASRSQQRDKLNGILNALSSIGGGSGSGNGRQISVGNVSPSGFITTPTGARIPAPPSASPQGNLHQWIMQALRNLGLVGQGYYPGVKSLIAHESGGNPYNINKWDSNWQAGHPSIGLMQTIPGTFQEYALKGHGNIYNPVDNIMAGIRYALSRYGSGMLKAGGRHDASGNYIGY